jgi:hypothetical protein
MSGTNPVATFSQSNFTTDTATAYKTKIDSNSIVMQRVVDCFAPRQSNTPAMTVTLDPGFVFKGTTLTEVAAQTTGTITAPVGNPRIDRVVVDRMSGAASVVTGTPAASPAAPAIPSGKIPICQVLLQTSSTSITNSMLTDERALWAIGRGTAGEEGIGQWLQDDGAGNLTLKVNPTLRDNGSGSLTTGLTTEASITAAATTDLGTLGSNIGVINGNTGITSFGNSASTANPFYVTRVTGTPLLTNSSNLILPGGANYQCAAGDMLFCKFEGTSKWRVGILTASGQPVVGASSSGRLINRTIYTGGVSGTWNKLAGTNKIKVVGHGAGAGTTGNGGNTTFDTLTANGGVNAGSTALGGTASGGDLNWPGGPGTQANTSAFGGVGGTSPGGPSGGGFQQNGGTPGAGCGPAGGSAFGGGAGARVEKWYTAPASASYSVGVGGTGTYTGGDGILIVEEYS